MFFTKKYFSAENVFIFQLFLHITLFFLNKVFCFLFFVLFCFVLVFLGGEGVRHSMLMIFLSWALYYAYKNAQILGAIQKVRTLWWRRGEGVLQKRAKTYKGRGIFQEYR